MRIRWALLFTSSVLRSKLIYCDDSSKKHTNTAYQENVSKTGYWLSNSKGTFFASKTVNPNIELPLYRPVLTQYTPLGGLSMTDEELASALATGFFQVSVPDELFNHIDTILRFLTSFSEERPYSINFNQDHPDVFDHMIQGFMIDNKKILPNDEIGKTKQLNQVWRLNLKRGPEHDFWKYIPPDVANALEHYKNFKISVLNSILDKIGVQEELRQQLTCGVSAALGDEYALFNDFRTSIESEHGLKEHKDYGIITALCSPVYRDVADVSERSGLEAYIEVAEKKQWVSIVPHEKAIIFNFGSALEKALKNYLVSISGLPPVKLNAAVHRVALSSTRRFSFANFGDPTLSSAIQTLHQKNGKQILVDGESYSEHCTEENKKLYSYR